MNFDANELERFSNLADSWWEPKGKVKPLHDINPLRMKWMETLIGSFSNKSILDIGCGGGILCESLYKAGGIVTGIDLSEKLIQTARLHQKESGSNIEYHSTSIENFSKTKKESYDIVTCMEMLEHVPDPASIVHCCSHFVKQEGWVFFSTFNRNLKSFIYGILGAEYILKLLPIGTHSYESFIKPSELARFSRNSGLYVTNLVGIAYNPIVDKYSLSKNVSVNYLMASQKLVI
ncbi:MAG: bifunctional 2-polyprenyl-6-hydroxyphenol methylase/3-demethylubiquinol 3-O-methyltransferase UbiG [Bordetella sp.]|nr:MAG: bifunctional 2-polyprenyl-6-hydroxyphenol methylase/3-demethylubiquinol 3-O-methyltransferase UbiG [Bordetella sp.]